MTATERTLVMYGEGAREAAHRMLPKLPEERFVPAGAGAAGVRDAVATAVEEGVAQVVLVAGLGEQIAVLGGMAGLLESVTLDMDCGVALAGEVSRAASPRDVYALWEAAGKLGPCGRELCRRTAGELERVAAEAAGAPDAQDAPVAAQVVLVDAAGERMVGVYGRMAR
ncbi:hypothetical protein SAMN05443665_10488 [Actinomadura meyerae]|uniref:Uncharacterized protein n=1 Tax=Actinomadura meyerae TaxID=240840 RepID=A0A239NTQ1_9ACTN|nr:hypothetical protein [Actinomadura meyerae]SNT57808.1 hypothetical protein SAMN05443665_10488 [Actinomadura meyerae]